MKKINFQIVTPEKITYHDDVDSITLPTQIGEITVLPHHAPLISSLKSGEAIIRKGGEEFSIAVSGGFLQVQPKNKVVVLADTAEMATAAAALEKSLIRLKEARRRSKRH